MLNKLAFYTKIGYKLIKKDVVDNEDYRKEYNKISITYSYWLNEMGRFTDKIIKLEYFNINKKLKILDFACGTGYITRSLIGKDINCEITAVDFSEKMLEELKKLNDGRVNAIHSDGIEFLKATEEKFDIIYFGWALSYFNYRELFPLFKKILNPGGIVGIITNVQGTLAGVEDIFMKVMSENNREVIRPMDIRYNLPNGKEGLKKWLNRYGFEAIEIKDGEVIFTFDEPDELLEWINKTGAAAGTAQIFKDYNNIRNAIIAEIKKAKYKDGKYEINHKFAYGLFKFM